MIEKEFRTVESGPESQPMPVRAIFVDQWMQHGRGLPAHADGLRGLGAASRFVGTLHPIGLVRKGIGGQGNAAVSTVEERREIYLFAP